jgi:hypothetical protein
MIYPNIKMLVKYLDEEGNESTIKAESIIFGCGLSGNECEITDEDGFVAYCDIGALLEVNMWEYARRLI